MSEATKPARRKVGKLAWVAVVFVILIALVLLASYFALKPANFTPLLLERIGQATGLQITAKGQSEINWRGTPYIVLRDVDARSPSAKTAVLTAKRIKIALPWMTLKSRGQDLVIDRVELDAAVLDLEAFRTWQGSRPKTTSRIPDFKHGISVTGGQVIGNGWRVESLDVRVPYFSMQAPVQGTISGQFTNVALRMRFDLGVAMSKPASGAGIGLNGSASIFAGDWALATRPRLRGVLSLEQGDVRIRNSTLGAFAEYRKGTDILPMSLGLHGDWLLNKEGLRLDPANLALRGVGKIPNLDAQGHISVGGKLDVSLTGELEQWPSTWPALPSPLNQNPSPVNFVLSYRGDTRLETPLNLRLARPDVQFDGTFRVNEILQWSQAMNQGTPIPPIAGHIKTPRLDIGDIRLEGVEIDIEND